MNTGPESEAVRRDGEPGPGLRWEGDGGLRRARALPWGSGDAATPTPTSHEAATSPREHRGRPEPETTVLDGLELAPLYRRAFAWLIDYALKSVIFFVILVVAGADPEAPITVTTLLAGQLTRAGYDWIFFTPGWSPGKRALGIRIVRVEDGSEPGPRRALLRVAGTMLSEAAFGLGFLWAIWDRRRQTWQDKLGRTYVVMAPRKESTERG
ncbi:MAG: RDD family protein [Dehalococcoidia bacterium]